MQATFSVFAQPVLGAIPVIQQPNQQLDARAKTENRIQPAKKRFKAENPSSSTRKPVVVQKRRKSSRVSKNKRKKGEDVATCVAKFIMEQEAQPEAVPEPMDETPEPCVVNQMITSLLSTPKCLRRNESIPKIGFDQLEPSSSCLKNMDGRVVLSPRSDIMSPVTPMKPLRIEWAEGDADFSL
uniref:Uncharacterized protein n=1 Tax=Lotharella globosa TaxID=91324 RepID=A0A7S3ZBK0_9EUKA|mmetsp:Transcript_33264/g.64310  ORF Transcript_33264/g.64310 Transcript_33264/m.64310 type:complete len:183 (+) Transcript_33264:53-601(+)|eukprot:CAMPEP_0167795004 /NCGR_PEP_ID=MMETSP0111_2-20121227/14175_1 /TAXON_ID=91324 /ORGANISM="Lotharella globosa, Strain CCCM811" /LENGTH=182 /DNA_ID=CAMNT_0007688585 /DNA_START=50 /DNA_END=598 /DNA_ORIENTATION=-